MRTFRIGSVHRLLGATLAALLVAAPAVGFADSDSRSDERASRTGSDKNTEASTSETSRYFANKHRRRLYEEGKLNYGEAVLWTLLLPGLGNFYARQYFLGGVNATLMAFTALIAPYGVLTRQMGFVWASVGLAGTAYVSGLVTSYFGVKTFNRRLRRGLRVSESGTPELSPPTGISFGFRF